MSTHDNDQHLAPAHTDPLMKSGSEFRLMHGLLLFAGYVLFDWASYFHPLHDLNITPWNPAAALGVVFMLRHGWRAALAIPPAIVIGDAWVRVISASFMTIVLLAMLLAAGYFGIAAVLKHTFRNSGMFVDRGGLLVWMLIVAIGTLIISFAFGAALVLLGVIPASSLPSALAGHWIGDCVGIIVAMPIIWMLTNTKGRAAIAQIVTRPEAAAILITAVLTFSLAFGAGGLADYKYFYLLFLPAIWCAARFGFMGAALMAASTQIGIAIGINYLDFTLVSAFEIQVLTVVLASVGFLLGIVVDEQRRISEELQQSLRLAAAGEMAGAIAHELNQPLTAISAYSDACEELIARGSSRDDLREPVRRIVKESVRAAEIVRRLRDFFRSGATRLEKVQARELIDNASEPFMARAKRENVRFSVSGDLTRTLLADPLQLEVVLRNLLANAFDAVSIRPPDRREVAINARLDEPNQLCIAVSDTGPGLPEEMRDNLYEPFRSTKTSGLGLGLAISRAIVQAHGGSLRVSTGASGLFELLLPLEKDIRDDHS